MYVPVVSKIDTCFFRHLECVNRLVPRIRSLDHMRLADALCEVFMIDGVAKLADEVGIELLDPDGLAPTWSHNDQW